MKISENKVVSLSYELSIRNGEEVLLVEKVTNEQPFMYLHGVSGLPEKFESALAELESGAAFDFVLSKEESGYGEFDETAIVDLPIEVFMVDGEFDAEVYGRVDRHRPPRRTVAGQSDVTRPPASAGRYCRCHPSLRGIRPHGVVPGIER